MGAGGVGSPPATLDEMADDDRTALFDSIEGDLAGVELALARLDTGAYFTCESCGRELSAAMLDDDPTRCRCSACVDPAPIGPSPRSPAPIEPPPETTGALAAAAAPASGLADGRAEADTTATADRPDVTSFVTAEVTAEVAAEVIVDGAAGGPSPSPAGAG